MNPRDHLAIALDVPGIEEASRLAAILGPRAGTFKVGLELFAAYGPSAVETARSHGASLFLDLKLHDIPRTVAAAVRNTAGLGARYLTLHALGGPGMITAAREASEECGHNRPLLLAVTVLTSHSPEELKRVGLSGTPGEEVMRLARMSVEAGADGLVCSPQEVAALRDVLGPGPILVTPGVRPKGEEAGDQARVATPGEAIARGADVLVIGRPIVKAPDPAAAADRVLAEIEAALGAR